MQLDYNRKGKIGQTNQIRVMRYKIDNLHPKQVEVDILKGTSYNWFSNTIIKKIHTSQSDNTLVVVAEYQKVYFIKKIIKLILIILFFFFLYKIMSKLL